MQTWQRVETEDVLINPIRMKIFELLRKTPDMRYTRIWEAVKVPTGTLQYSLKILAQGGFIKPEREEGKPDVSYTPAWLPAENTTKSIVYYLLAKGANSTELKSEIGLYSDTLDRYLSWLRGKGAIIKNGGRRGAYHLTFRDGVDEEIKKLFETDGTHTKYFKHELT